MIIGITSDSSRHLNR